MDDLKTELANGYLIWLEKQKNLSGTSIRNHRIGLLVIWNYAVHPLGVAGEYVARRVRCPRIDRQPVTAWQLTDVAKLLDASRQLAGLLKCGLPRALVMEAWIRLGVETGLRPSDLRAITWDCVNLRENRISLVQNKTRHPILCGFSDSTAKILKRLKPYQFDNVLPVSKTVVWKMEQRLYRIASNCGFKRRKRQGIGMLRKTHGTEVYREHGLSAAAESLGHRSGEKIARDHYVDSRVQRVYSVRLPG